MSGASVGTDRRLGVNAGLAVKAPCVAVAAAPITLSGLQTVGSVAIASGQRVLCMAQADATTNGIYVASTAAWTRDIDFDGTYDVTQGTIVTAFNGTTDDLYVLTSANPIYIDYTVPGHNPSAINFLPLSISQIVGVLVGNTYLVSGDVLSVDGISSGTPGSGSAVVAVCSVANVQNVVNIAIANISTAAFGAAFVAFLQTLGNRPGYPGAPIAFLDGVGVSYG